MTRRRIALAGLALLAAGAGCGGGKGPVGPIAGDLTVALFQGGPTPGALLLTVTGGAVQSVTALPGVQVTSAAAGPGVTRLLVTGTIGTGDLFRLRVPDIELSAGYTVRTDQAADNVTFALLNPADFTLVARR